MALFTIPLGTPFLKAVAHGVLELCQTHQISMKDVTIYVPYTRAISHLRDAFQRIAAPQKLGLPAIQALGEIETTDPQDPESAPDTCPLRLGLLTQLVQAYQDKQRQAKAPHHTSQGPPPFHLTLDLAQTLVNLLDQCAIEEVPLEGLFALVGAEFANHWQLTLDFLKMLVQEWPALRDQWQIKEPYTAHHQAMNRFIDTLKVSPPKGWIIVAGSTGTMPATARFMKAINQI